MSPRNGWQEHLTLCAGDLCDVASAHSLRIGSFKREVCRLGVVLGCTLAFLFGAIVAYDPARGFLARRNTPAG